MISDATQTLAEFLTDRLSHVGVEHISIEHPRLRRGGSPGVNLYCYHVQANPTFTPVMPCATAAVNRDRPVVAPLRGWFDLTFLVSAIDHTSLGEQHLLSEVLAVLSDHAVIPEEMAAPGLRGQGPLPICVSTQPPVNAVMLWSVLCTPLQLAVHLTLTVPLQSHSGGLL